MEKHTLLSGLKVVDASTVLAGPSVGTYFAELGAEVVKIEHPTLGDVTRSWKLPSEYADSPISNYFSSVNFGKTYFKLNLKVEEDRNQFLKIVSESDILLSNFKHGDAEKFHLTDDVLHSFNPKLIHGKINGFGENSDRVAYDLILQAETGFMSMNGQSDGPPTKMPVALIDVLAAHHLKEAILLALYQREKTLKGVSVSVSLYAAAVSSLMNQASNYLMSNSIPKRIGSLHPNIAPYGEIFKTKDQADICFAIGSDKHFGLMCAFLNLTELITNEQFASNSNRVKNRIELAEMIQAKVADFDAATILAHMEAHNVPCGKIKNLHEVFEESSAKNLILSEEMEGKMTQRVQSAIFQWT
jgi:crotonobetainyl-CoA:carnitine CoA-transferase CaiB-like acyl-CoA transferase